MSVYKNRKQLKKERLENVEINEDGLSYAEISKILNIPIYKVKKIETDALRKLQSPTNRNKVLHKYWELGQRPEERIDI